MLLLIMLSGALPLDAQTLDVCNKGMVTVEVVVATRANLLLPKTGYWVIRGTPVASGACERVYDEGLGDYAHEYAAYIGFGFADSQGRWGAGTVDRVPDMGSSQWALVGHPILSKGEKILCVRQDKTGNKIERDPLPQMNCATLTVPNGVGQGPFVPLAAVLYFQPEGGRPYRTNLGGFDISGGVKTRIAEHAARQPVAADALRRAEPGRLGGHSRQRRRSVS
jgi:hypothetical protein